MSGDGKIRVRRAQRSRQFFIVNQETMNIEMSAEEAGVYWYLLSRPDDWLARGRHLGERFGTTRQRIYRILGRLAERGLIRKVVENGQVEYLVGEPESGGEGVTKSNTPLLQNRTLLNTDKPKYIESDRVYQFAVNMLERIREIYPATREPDLQKWAHTIHLTVTRDEVTIEELWKVFRWANKDDFWSENIRSPVKLRKHYETLHARMTKECAHGTSRNPGRKGRKGPSSIDLVSPNFV